MHKHYIKDDQALIDFCREIENSPVLAVDTEFVRTRTLYPKLGLLQVCNGEHIALIDPITISDLSPFWALIKDEKIRKVLHACSEDLEVFLTVANCRPVNLIDSQIMMSFLGQGISMGYAAMIQHYLEIELDKSESRTDWTKRPLTEKQKNYAEADVTHLFNVFPKVLNDISEAGWLHAAQHDTDLMISRKFTPIDQENLYQGVKMAWKLAPSQLLHLKHLATWRYQRAVQKDYPLGFIAKDNTLIGLAQYNPKSVGAMLEIEGVEVLDVRHQGKAMLTVLKQTREIDSVNYPEKITRLDEYPGYKQIFKKVKNLTATIAEKINVQAEVLASKKQLNQFLSWHFKLNGMADKSHEVDVLLDWRKDVLGNKLIELAEKNFAN